MSPRESIPDHVSLRLQGTKAISEAADAARAFGHARQLPSADLARLCIVVEELIANLYDHGRLTERDEIRLTLAAELEGVRITLIDPGAPFNPWSASQTAESMTDGGGAGVRLIQAWTELITYRRSSERNHLELRVPARLGPGKPPA